LDFAVYSSFDNAIVRICSIATAIVVVSMLVKRCECRSHCVAELAQADRLLHSRPLATATADACASIVHATTSIAAAAAATAATAAAEAQTAHWW
jgi:hypothetical protein